MWPGATGRFIHNHFEIGGMPDNASVLAIIARLQDAGLAGALTPELAKEREELEERKSAEANLKRVRKTLKSSKRISDSKERELRDCEGRLSKLEALSEQEEARRDQLGKLLRSGFATIGDPFDLHLDWWQGDSAAVLKPWAGSMQVRRMAAAALAECFNAFSRLSPFEYACVLRPTDDDEGEEDSEAAGEEGGKAEPFYFDSTRGTNASPLDIGFSPNKLSVERTTATKTGKAKTKKVKMETIAFPAVEFFALVGLQRFRPAPTGTPRVLDYWTWSVPLPPALAAAAVCGMLPGVGGERYRFENGYRTDHRKHKGFLAATRITNGDTT
ncbi:MAG TPA: hypothetical protein PK098_01335 [Phycisphaerales bacterium]|nr:hypothetical protein [Phycisphaerales bacterium]